MRGEEDLQSVQRRPKRQRLRMSEDEGYGLLATQSKLGLAGCNSRWAGDVNNAITASESQLLARPRHASAGRCRLITGRQAPGRLYAVCFGFDFAWLLRRLQWL